MQIQSRLTIQFAALVALILFITLVSIYQLSKLNFENRFYERLEKKAITTGKLLLGSYEVDTLLLKKIQQESTDIYFGENIEVYSQNQTRIYASNDTINFNISAAIFSQLKGERETKFISDQYEVLGIQYKKNVSIYYVFAGGKDDYGNSRLESLKKILILIFILMTLFGTLVGWGYSNRALMPVNIVIRNVQSLSSNLSDRLIELDTQDEIGKLVVMFNNFLERIEQSVETQKSFITNVSHELKNPLTKITSQLEVTLLKDRSNIEYKDLIQSVLEDIKDLNHLSISLLDLVSLENQKAKIKTIPMRLDQVLWEQRDLVEASHKSYTVNIGSTGMPPDENYLLIQANQDLIKIAFRNLIENACKFSENSQANVSISWTPLTLKVSISDTGPGISDSDIKKIFEPFYRADNSFKTAGHGIGLSLSKKIIELHNGSLEIDSKLGFGTTVNVIFNRVNHL
jgi:signal transduction histidine kinase